MDLSDPRFQRKTIPWAKLEADGFEARAEMKEAQRQRNWSLARKAAYRWNYLKRLAEQVSQKQTKTQNQRGDS